MLNVEILDKKQEGLPCGRRSLVQLLSALGSGNTIKVCTDPRGLHFVAFHSEVRSPLHRPSTGASDGQISSQPHLTRRPPFSESPQLYLSGTKRSVLEGSTRTLSPQIFQCINSLLFRLPIPKISSFGKQDKRTLVAAAPNCLVR